MSFLVCLGEVKTHKFNAQVCDVCLRLCETVNFRQFVAISSKSMNSFPLSSSNKKYALLNISFGCKVQRQPRTPNTELLFELLEIFSEQAREMETNAFKPECNSFKCK